MQRGSIEVSTWNPTPITEASDASARSAELGATLPRKRPSLLARLADPLTDRLPGAVVGAILTILLHTQLLTSVLWAGGAMHAHRRQKVGSSSLPQNRDDSALQGITIDLVTEVSSSRSMAGVPPVVPPKLARIDSARRLAADLSATLASLDVELQHSSEAAGDPAALSAMAGRYLGQIDARIERAWLRPRSGIGAPLFTCRVKIIQDRAGNVLSVTLEDCNGTERWRRSLVAAIETASPLPAPPDPHVFASVVHMSFRALPYSSESPPGEYESVRLAQAEAASDGESEKSAGQELERFHDALQHPHPNEVIKLTLTGSGSESPSVLPPLSHRLPEAQLSK